MIKAPGVQVLWPSGVPAKARDKRSLTNMSKNGIPIWVFGNTKKLSISKLQFKFKFLQTILTFYSVLF